jgi:hypothetical protein
MKIVQISAVLGLVMALSSSGAFADDEAALPVAAPVTAATTDAEEPDPVVEEAPALDLVFCIDSSRSMADYEPILK